VAQNWPNLEKRPLFLQFYQNFLNFLFCWKIWQIGFFCHLIIAFKGIFFWLGCDAWKMDDQFQRPLWPISIIINFSKNLLVKADIKQLSPKKKLRSFDDNWRNTSHIRTWWVDSPPPLGFFRVTLVVSTLLRWLGGSRRFIVLCGSCWRVVVLNKPHEIEIVNFTHPILYAGQKNSMLKVFLLLLNLTWNLTQACTHPHPYYQIWYVSERITSKKPINGLK
jgi:hypothetical protein